MSSNANTPMLEPYSSQTLPPPSPAPLAAADAADAAPSPVPDDLPPLEIGVLREDVDKLDAFNLVTDSVAQQRQLASLYLVFHPLLLVLLTASLGAAFQYSWRMRQDLGMALMLHSGVVMTYLLGIRYFTGQYVHMAEEMKWRWLVSEDTGEEDTIIGVRFGQVLVGALVLRLERPPNGAALRKRTRGSALKGGKGVIRAWTVMLRYRGKGVGSDLLHEAVKVAREKCGRDAAVGFAKGHANSAMVVPEVFNRQFRKDEQRAIKALEKVVTEWEGSRRKR